MTAQGVRWAGVWGQLEKEEGRAAPQANTPGLQGRFCSQNSAWRRGAQNRGQADGGLRRQASGAATTLEGSVPETPLGLQDLRNSPPPGPGGGRGTPICLDSPSSRADHDNGPYPACPHSTDIPNPCPCSPSHTDAHPLLSTSPGI